LALSWGKVDSTEIYVALITGVFGLFGLILTGSLWKIFKGMVEGLQTQVITQGDQIGRLQEKVDALEKANYEALVNHESYQRQKEIEITRLQEIVDDYVAAVQQSKLDYNQLSKKWEAEREKNLSLKSENEFLARAIRRIAAKLNIELNDLIEGSSIEGLIDEISKQGQGDTER
jgi:pyruvate/2-oxoglutarate dehydrogenase complex dihydrolipoamide acyltransferase (E2) component